MSKPPRIVCFGEILWDFLPSGLFAGGAPFNVGYHLRQHGADVHLISAVGRDVLGDELLRRLRDWKIDTGLITRHSDLPTGYVRASIGKNGDARYEIIEAVAWDEIAVGAEVSKVITEAQAFVFGSLAQRTLFNRTALTQILEAEFRKSDGPWLVFDVNLRAPYDDLSRVRSLAAKATLLKLNAEEAARLCEDSSGGANLEEKYARALAASIGCPIICITSGARGAGLLRENTWHWEPGREVKVADTVGAGDAFLASLLINLLERKPSDSACLARACRTGEWVASQSGATPSYETRHLDG